MNKIFVGIAVLNSCAVIILGVLQYSASPRIAFIDSAKILNEYRGMHEAKTLYQSKVSVWKANIDTLSSEVEMEIQKYQKEKIAMSAKERTVIEQLIASKRSRLSDYQGVISAQAQREETEMMKGVLDVVNSALKTYGEEHGYEVIMAATEYGNIAFGDERIDITDQVLIELNRGYSSR